MTYIIITPKVVQKQLDALPDEAQQPPCSGRAQILGAEFAVIYRHGIADSTTETSRGLGYCPTHYP